jgi:hypothetical protein
MSRLTLGHRKIPVTDRGDEMVKYQISNFQFPMSSKDQNSNDKIL